MRSNSSLVPLYRALMSPRTALVTLAGALAIGGCSAGPEDEADGLPDFSGSIPGMTGNQTANPANPGPSPASNGSPSGTQNTQNTSAPSAGEQNPASGAPIAPSTNANGSGGSANVGSANTGAGGSSMVPNPPSDGSMGAAGSSMGVGGSAGTVPVTPPPGAEQPPPVTPVIDTECPDGAFFCSGFEQATLPEKTVFGGGQFPDAFLLDTTQFHSGRQSFFLPLTNQAFSYRVMAIPVPVQAFWARVFVRFDTLFGDGGHDALFAVSDSDSSVDNNNETRIEFAEQEGTIVLNRSTDQITFPIVRPTTLTANTWHCVEARYDGGAGDLEIFADGQAIISRLGNPQFQFRVQTFRIGTLQFHEPRNVWFDDVVLDTERVGCN
jgi:hypothetical protein